ncbi:MAG: pyridoxal phosphate-dependent aminotransferase family protein [Planctomycetota bacterium]
MPLRALSATRAELPNGRSVTTFAGCNYLAIHRHPRVLESLSDGLQRYGVSAGASRETTGNTDAHEALEAELKQWLGVEDALLLPDGYIANIAAAQALAKLQPLATVHVDARSHPSVLDALSTAGCSPTSYEHANAAAVDQTQAIFTDSVFTGSGELAPVAALLNRLPTDGYLILDDCHGVGSIGPLAQGTAAHLGISDPRLIITGTLSKGIGCAGGYVAGPAAVIAAARASSAFICTTPIPPALALASRTAIRIAQTDDQRRAQLTTNAQALKHGLRKLGLTTSTTPTPIATFTFDAATAMRDTHERLLSQGLYAPLINYPGGPAQSYFRIVVTAEHTQAEIDRLIDCLAARVRTALALPLETP